jgi:hypothetical protein
MMASEDLDKRTYLKDFRVPTVTGEGKGKGNSIHACVLFPYLRFGPFLT